MVLMKLQQSFARHDNQLMLEKAAFWQMAALLLLIAISIILIPLFWWMIQTLRALKRTQQTALDAITNVFHESLVVAGRDELDTLVTTIELTTNKFMMHTTELEQARNTLDRQHGETKRLTELNTRLQHCQEQLEARQIVEAFAPGLFLDISGLLAIFTPTRDSLSMFAVWGNTDEARVGSIEPDQCWALRQNQPHFSTDDRADVRCGHIATAAALCVPLNNQDGVMGLISLDISRTTMAMGDIEALATKFANLIALSLTNLRLRETLREQSIVDLLSSLYNRRYFEEALPRELSRATRREHSVVLLVLDVDHFKRFNDTHGHDVGDRILHHVGTTIKASIRPSDIACRYGGEEFVVIMPELSSDSAMARADELRQQINRAVGNLEQGRFGPVTVSGGLALFPRHAACGADLFVAADKALYEAKKAGRNRIEVAPETENERAG